MIRSEPVERRIIFKTNQGTDAHLMEGKMASLKDGRSYILGGLVSAPPRTIEGGHVIFSTVYGAVKNHTINLEKIEIKSLAESFIRRNPMCKCGKRMKSSGRNQGYRCKKCGTRAEAPEYIPVDRGLELGLYEVPPSARRHISKPLVRMSGNVHPSI